MYFKGERDARRFLIELCVFCNAGVASLVMLVLDLVPWFMLPGAVALGASYLISRRAERQMPSLVAAGRTASLFAKGGGAQQRYFGRTAIREAISTSHARPALKIATNVSQSLLFTAPVLIVLAVVFDWGGS